MARAIVELYHPGSGDAAEATFDRVFKRHELPDDIVDVTVPMAVFEHTDDGWTMHVPALLEAMGLASSRSEARRLQAQGGVRVNGEQIASEEVRVDGDPPGGYEGSVWQVGRRRYARLAGVEGT